MSSIEGKVVVITGASSGLGEATARLLASSGAKVFLGARRTERLNAVVTDIRRAGGQAASRTVDVTKPAEVEAFIHAAVEQFGRIDVVVNNAGLMAFAPLAKALIDEWDRMIDINLKGVLYGIAAALPIFERQHSGHQACRACALGGPAARGGRRHPHHHHLSGRGAVGAAARELRSRERRASEGLVPAHGHSGGCRGPRHRLRHRATRRRGRQRDRAAPDRSGLLSPRSNAQEWVAAPTMSH